MAKAALSEADVAIRQGVAQWIRYWALTKKKKATEMARAGGVSIAVQYRIEAGETTPDAIYLVRLAAYLQISLDQLCGVAQEQRDSDQVTPEVTQIANGTGIVQVAGTAKRNRVTVRNNRTKFFGL